MREDQNQGLPYGVGSITDRWLFLVILCVLGMFLGFIQYLRQLTYGEYVTVYGT